MERERSLLIFKVKGHISRSLDGYLGNFMWFKSNCWFKLKIYMSGVCCYTQCCSCLLFQQVIGSGDENILVMICFIFYLFQQVIGSGDENILVMICFIFYLFQQVIGSGDENILVMYHKHWEDYSRGSQYLNQLYGSGPLRVYLEFCSRSSCLRADSVMD